MKRINQSVINWYELSLYKEEGYAELKRYNRPATTCDHEEVFIQRLTVDQYYKLAHVFGCFALYHTAEWCDWYTVGVSYPGDENCYRAGKLYRM